MSGFDVFKYFKLLSVTNLSTIDWLNSNIVYLGNHNTELKIYVENNFDKAKLFFQYYSNAKSSFK